MAHSPPSSLIARIVEQYIGVDAGYLVGFSRNILRNFYQDYCDIDDIDTSVFEGTTRQRFIDIFRAALPDQQAKILRGIIAKFPFESFEGSEQKKRQSIYNEIVEWKNKLELGLLQKAQQTHAERELQSLREELSRLKIKKFNCPELPGWQLRGEAIVESIFGKPSKEFSAFKQIKFVRSGRSSSFEAEAQWNKCKQEMDSLILAFIRQIKDPVISMKEKVTELRAKDKSSASDIFLIHGHDEQFKAQVAKFLKSINFNPIILHEKPNEGRTIVEKFEAHSRVTYAIALLSEDDKCVSKDQISYRARQNVILEMGYFWGMVGRKNIVALVKGKVERPSDYDGVLYIPFDDSMKWTHDLIREMNAAGFSVPQKTPA